MTPYPHSELFSPARARRDTEPARAVDPAAGESWHDPTVLEDGTTDRSAARRRRRVVFETEPGVRVVVQEPVHVG